MKGIPIRVTAVAGTPAEMGEAHGTAHAEEIRTYAAGRVELAVEHSVHEAGVAPQDRFEVIFAAP